MKRLKKTVPSKNTTRKKNNGGMTYVELLVALSLLVLIVTMFSPMLLSSYDKIYRAGETTSNAFNAKYDIEEGLAYREDHLLKDIAINFNAFGENLYYKARRVASVLDGFNLETLYFGAKGKAKVVTASVVSDNQNEHNVKLELKNLGVKKPKSCSSLSEAQTPGADELRFYVHGLFDDTKGLTCTFSSAVGNSKYIEMLIKDVDITKSPLKILAYYLDENGDKKEIVTYLDIEPADIMFVGGTNSEADYFTSAGVNPKDKSFYIASRKMTTAAIGAGKTLNDVEWVAPDNVFDGYYLMCGNDGIVRRLWHAKNTPKTNDVTFKEKIENGKQYFQYDWDGDYVDTLELSDKAGRGNLSYGSNSTDLVTFGEDNYLRKDQFSMSYLPRFAYYINGFTSGNNSYKNDTKRISYVLGLSASDFSDIYKTTPTRDGYIVKKIRAGDDWVWYDNYEQNGVSADGIYDDRVLYDQRYIYKYSENTWYKFSYDWRGRIDGYESQNLKGLDLGVGLVDGKNAVKSSGVFKVRNDVVEDNAWASNENVSLGKPDSADQDRDRSIAYITLKAYSSMSPTDLVATSTVEAKSQPQKGIVDLTSCIKLPNGTNDALYLGKVNTSALINETKGITATSDPYNDYTSDVGFGGSHIFIGDDDGVYTVNYDQYEDKKAYIDGQAVYDNKGHYLKDPATSNDPATITKPVPSSRYGRDRLKSTINSYTTFDKDTDMRFTLGYSSDLFAVYSGLAGEDEKPLEGIYSASAGVSDSEDLDSAFRKNIWFPREFLNITESVSYNNSIVAVGYDIGGYSKIFYDTRVEYTNGVNKRFLGDDPDVGDDLDLDNDNNGVVDLFDLGPGDHVYDRINAGHEYSTAALSKGLFYTSPYGSDYYIIDAGPGLSCKDEKIIETALALPKHTTISTVVDKIVNNGVISVYNEGEGTFTPIYYYKDPGKNSVRFNCVSAFDMGNNTVGAAVGMSNGGLMLVPITYTADGFVKTAVTKSSCTETGAIDEITSISAIKALSYDYDSDGANEALIIAGGVRATGKKIVLRVWDVTDTSATKSFKIQLDELGTATDVSEITDIAIINGYIYVSGRRGTDKGVIFSCPLSWFTELAGKETQVDPITEIEWLKTVDYYSDFTFGSEAGEVKGKTKKTGALPVINSIAAKTEQ